MVIDSARPPGRFGQRARWPGPSRRPRLRRRLAVISGLLTVIAVVGAVGWFEGMPRYRPSLQAGEQYGLDVSNHQGPIDWDEVAQDGISLAYIKATEGDDFGDKRFAQNWTGAAAAGLVRGAYHFFTLCSSGAHQAANFLQALPADPDALPPAVDLEFSACAQRPDNATFQRELNTFIEIIEAATGRELVIYAMPSFTNRYPMAGSTTRARWVRRLFRRPADDGWSVWQVSDRARVDGIGEPVDLDVWRVRKS